MKVKATLLFTVLIGSILSLTFLIPEIDAPTFGSLTISGRHWVDSDGNIVLLKGVLYPWHDESPLWINYITDEVHANLTAIANNGFNLVVILAPMYYWWESDNTFNATQMGYLNDFLAACRARELYVMLRAPDYAADAGWVHNRWENSMWYFNVTFRNEQSWFLGNLSQWLVARSYQDMIVGVDLWSEAEKTYNYRGLYDPQLNSTAILPLANASWQQWLQYRYGSLSTLNEYWEEDPVMIQGEMGASLTANGGDTFVTESANSSSAQSGWSAWYINPASGFENIAFLKFNFTLAGMVNQDPAFINASLRLFSVTTDANAFGKTMEIQRATNDSWTSATLTWLGMQPLNNSVTGTIVNFTVPTTTQTWTPWINVTDIVSPDFAVDNVTSIRIQDFYQGAGGYRISKFSAINAEFIPTLRIYMNNAAGVATFQDIPLTTQAETAEQRNPRNIDYRKFLLQRFYELTEIRKDAIKTAFDFPVTASVGAYIYRAAWNSYNTANFIQPESVENLCEFLSWDPYSPREGDISVPSTFARRFNKPLMAMEYGAKYPTYSLDANKRFWTRAYEDIVAYDFAASAIWAWQDPMAGASADYGLVWANGTEKDILPHIEGLNANLTVWEPYVGTQLWDNDIAIIYPMTSRLQGVPFGYQGQFAQMPLAFSHRNIYPNVVYAGPSRTQWDRTLFHPDDLDYVNSHSILVYTYDGGWGISQDWWDDTLMESSVDLISRAYPHGKVDEYGTFWEGELDIYPWKMSSTSFLGETVPAWTDNGTFLWGQYQNMNFSVRAYNYGTFIEDYIEQGLSRTTIGNLTHGGSTVTTMIANSRVFATGDYSFNARTFFSINESGLVLPEGNDLHRKVPTALEWFDYTPRFSITDTQVRCQVFNQDAGSVVLFGNQENTSRTFTFSLTKLNDYGMTSPTLYNVTWVNGTSIGLYSGSSLQNSLSITLPAFAIEGISIVQLGQGYPENTEVTILNMDSGNYLFANEKYYEFQAKYADGDEDISLAKVRFYDGNAVEVRVAYTDSSSDILLETGSSVAILNPGTATWSSGVFTLTFSILLTDAVADINDVSLFLYVEDDDGNSDGWENQALDYCNIYNLGGLAVLETSGTAGRITGGDVFELYAQNNSWAQATVTYRKLQAVHYLYHVWIEDLNSWDDWETDNITVTMGIDYYSEPDSTWLSGWNVFIEQKEGWIGSGKMRLQWNVTWSYRGSVVTSTTMNSFPLTNTTTDGNPASTSFIFDAWFNKVNASSTVGGRLVAEYFAMADAAPAWLQWTIFGNAWGVDVGNVTQAMFFEDLKDVNNNIISVKQAEMTRVWVKLAQGANTYDVRVELRDYDLFDITTKPIGEMEGVNTPVFVPTKTPSMPQGGFLSTLVAALQAGWASLSYTVGVGLLASWTIFLSFLDTVAAAVGVPGFFTLLNTWVANFWDWILISMTNLILMFVSIFSIFAVTLTKVVSTFSQVISQWVSMINQIVYFLDTGYGSATGLWETLGMSSWILVAAILYPMWLLFMWDEKGLQPVLDHIKFVIDVIYMVIHVFIVIIQNGIAFISYIVEAIPVVE